ncbi:MAG: hypothetical protein J6A88_01375 [Oscillospiraceae bacterium]|nr:hypothetical protein [Oscillospiraceae bacterium]
MEEERIDNPEIETIEEENEKPAYTPRPKWQIVLAWIGVAIMAASIIMYYWQIANGGI